MSPEQNGNEDVAQGLHRREPGGAVACAGLPAALLAMCGLSFVRAGRLLIQDVQGSDAELGIGAAIGEAVALEPGAPLASPLS